MKVKLLTGAVVLAIIGSIYLNANQTKVVDTPNEETHPGFMEQFAEMKLNERGEMPRLRWKEWAAASAKMHGKADFFNTVNELGPSNIGGRTRSLLVDAADPNHLIAGAVSGGIWISNNRGLTWSALDDDASALSVTAITQNPFNASEIYYSTGELNTGAEANYNGDGIFRSVDGGKTFNQIPGTGDIIDFTKTWDIEYSKTDSNTFYVATIGSTNVNGQRVAGALYRTQDKGETFTKISTEGTVNDIDAMSNGTVYFTVRTKGVYSFKEQDTVKITKQNIPISTTFTRVLVAFADSDTNVLYAAFAGADRNSLRSIYKSTNGGATWNILPKPTNSFRFTWYCFMLEVAPDNPNFLLCGAQYASYSNNGGSTWITLRNSHADYHTASFIPNSSQYFVLNDGGIYQYSRTSSNLLQVDRNQNYNSTQLYAGSFFPTGDRCLLGAQDNWTTTNATGGGVFTQVLGGDGSYNAIDSTGDYVYASSQNGNLRRFNSSSNTWTSIYNPLRSVVGTRFWFINPFTINPADGRQLYFPTRDYIGRSTDRGTRWSRITNFITGNVYCVATTKEDNPTLYFGGKGSILYRIDSAKTATAGSSVQFKPIDRPANARVGFIGSIEIDPNNSSTIYLSYADANALPRAWKVENADSDDPTWVDISGNLPTGLPVNWLEVDPENSDHIMAATDYGVYVTANGGRFWHKETRIPNVYVPMIRLRETDRKLFVFTYGRGVWTADLNSTIIASTPNQTQPGNTFRVFPNPAQDFVTIDLDGVARVQLIGLNGQQNPLVEVQPNTYTLEGIRPGIYVINVAMEDGRILNQKLVVE